MAKSFKKLTRSNIRKIKSGEQITEHGIDFFRQADGDGRYTVNIMVDGQRVHRVIGKESDGVTRKQAEDFIQKVRTDAREGRLNLPKEGRITYLATEQIDSLIKAAINDQFHHIYLFIVVGLETSMRRSEILSIKIENIVDGRKV